MDQFHYYRTDENPDASQLLGVFHEGKFYRFSLETFHLHEIPASVQEHHSEHSHDVYHLVLYHLGGDMSLEGRVLDVRSGSLVWTSPGECHSFATTGEKRAAYHELTFRLLHEGDALNIPFGELLSLYFGAECELPERPLVLTQEQYRRLGNAYETVPEALKRHHPHGSLLILLTAFADIARTQYTPDKVIDARLAQAARLLGKNLDKPLRLADVAARIGMSKEYFCREFTRLHGLPPMRFRRNLRVTLAAQMLRYSDKPLKAIAAELGFGDIQHLSHAFKAYSGCSPHRFRQQSRA